MPAIHPKLEKALEFRDQDEVFRFNPRIDIGDLTWHFRRRGRIDVLVVVDGLSYDKSPGAFGVGRVIDLLRGTSIGCTDIVVDVASRSTASAFADHGNGGWVDGHLRYSGFQFDSAVGGNLVLDRYDTVLLFGSSSLDPNSVNGAEQAAIAGWMQQGGGVFATGDHATLGQRMCAGIPKVRSMRRWTSADGVPPGGGPDRIDTNQPANAAEMAGVELIEGTVERDAVPQPITWHPEATWGSIWKQYSRPHEVLCHPVYGPIDVMPDHPHEGLCLTAAEIAADPAKAADFPGVQPKVIATGKVVPDPPFMHQKGAVNEAAIPMVAVYDGWKEEEDAGRIVVDSTWHHWLDMNLDGLAAENGPEWAKISRYFINVVKWTARKGAYRSFCGWTILNSFFVYPGIEEFSLKGSLIDHGRYLHQHLRAIHGPCTVSTDLCELLPWICTVTALDVRRQRVLPLPVELLEASALGGVIEAVRPVAEKLRDAMEVGEEFEIHIEELEERIEAGAKRGAAMAIQQVKRDCREIDGLIGQFDG